MFRADLWAYAAKVAVEYATEHNNYQCAGRPSDWVKSGESAIKNLKDCVRNVGEDDCEVSSLNCIRICDISTEFLFQGQF